MMSFEFDGKNMIDDYLRENQDSIRSETEAIARQLVADAIGQENLSKVTLRFSGTGPDNTKVHLVGPEELIAKIEEVLPGGMLGQALTPR